MRKLFLLSVLLLTISIVANSQGAGTAASIYKSTFANLGNPGDGSVRYCTNCTPNTTPATSGGTGAFVDRVNGVWVARASAAASGGTVTSVSVVTANGLSGTVATATTTPAITLNIASLDPLKLSPGTIDSTEFGFLNGVTSGIQTQFSGKVSGPASVTDNHLAVFDGTTGKLIKDGGVIPSGITNSAGANVVPKSDGTNLVASQITDDGAEVDIATGVSKTIQIGGGAGTSANFGGVGQNAGCQIASDTVTNCGDFVGTGNATQLVINDTTGIIDLIASNGVRINNLSINTGGTFLPNVAGNVTVGSSALPFTAVVVGNAANNTSTITGTFTTNREVSLPDATGTIQLVGAANTGSVFGIPVNNTVLATATGTVYSSPGNDGTALSIATEGNVSFPITRAGTIRNLYVRTGGTAQVNTPTTVVTVRKNGVDTTVTLTMTQTVNTTTSDTTHSFTVAAGDLITVSFATTGAAGVSTSIAGVSFELD